VVVDTDATLNGCDRERRYPFQAVGGYTDA